MSVLVAGDCRASIREIIDTAATVCEGRYEAASAMGGSYWLVVHDAARSRTIVAGDLAEVRAVFYARTPQGVVWATRADLLAELTGASPDLDMLAAQIAVGTAEHWPDRSVWRGVSRVAGGNVLVLNGGSAKTVDARPTQRVGSIEEGAAAVGEALWRATQAHARSAGGRVSADLSGGLDSSTAVVAASSAADVLAVTYGGPLADEEDTRLAARVAEFVGAEHHVSEGAISGHFSSWPEVAPYAPVLAVSSHPLDLDYLPPARNVSPVHLTGHGGDVVLESSSAAYTAMAQAGDRRRASRAVTEHARRYNMAPGPLLRNVREAAKGRPRALERAAYAVASGQAEATHRLWTWCAVGSAARWLTDLGRQRVADLLAESSRTVGDEEAGEWDDWSALRYNGAAVRDSRPLFTHLGVNPVSPYLDNEVVRACFAVPATARRRAGEYKPLLASARPDLPSWLTDRRTKGSFSPLLHAGLGHNHRALHSMVEQSPLVRCGLFDAHRIQHDLAAAAGGVGRTPVGAVEMFFITTWWLKYGLPVQQPAGDRAGAAC
ncbi:asparagine synthase-related protein [Streptomyces albidoflavus]|uniref:asparagine synthase-related protein n=1 Tax=Streptomyces albidoflavus TaxID=1886 RepID=UPI001596C068|nr:asparagine synthase-related protein [Streptomyces albidoflavus]